MTTTVYRPDAPRPSPGAIALLQRDLDARRLRMIAAAAIGNYAAVAQHRREIAALEAALRDAGVAL